MYLAAFGKHPGWDDHIEDIGIETDQLAALKQLLYVQGIGRAIDSGAWDNLADVQRVEGYQHVFVRRTPTDVIAGRLWSSTDGKGRTRYPMVVCVQCSGLPLRWVVREILPRLESLQQRCEAVSTAGEVVATLEEARGEYRALADQASIDPADYVISPSAAAELADRPELGSDHEGVLRILYLLERESPAFLRGSYAATRSGEFRPIQVRVPPCGTSPPDVLLRWLEFMYAQVDPAAEVWALLALDQPWLDIFIGPPAPRQFTCLQSSREALPLASEIPYTLSDEFVDRAEQAIAAARSGTAEPVVLRPEAAAAPGRGRPPLDLAGKLAALTGSRTFRIALVAVLGIALLVGLLIAAVTLWPESAPPKPDGRRPGDTMAPRDAEAWGELCTTLYEWLGPFLADVDADRLALWRTDRHLADRVVPVLEEVLDGKVELDPREFAGLRGSSLRFLARDEKPKPPDVLRKTHEALGVVRALQKDLGLAPEAGAAGWPSLATLSGLAGEYERRGWHKQSDYLASVAEQVAPRPDLAGHVDAAVRAAAAVAALETHWREIRDDVTALDASGSPLLAKFGEYVAAKTATEAAPGSEADLAAMKTVLVDVRSRSAPLATFVQGDWRGGVDLDYLRREPPVRAPYPPEKLRSGEVFLTWLYAVKSPRYRSLDANDDPRAKPGWKQAQGERLTRAGEAIGKLKTVHGDPNAPRFAETLGQLRSDYDRLCARKWDRLSKEQVETSALAFAPKLKAFHERVDEVLAEREGGLEAYRKTIPTTVAAGSEEIDRFWQEKVRELQKLQSLSALKARVRKLKADLRALEDELKPTLGRPAPGAWGDALRRIVRARREEALKAALAKLPWQGGQIVRSAEFESHWKQLAGRYGQWRDELGRLAAAFGTIEAALNKGAQLADAPASADGPIARTYARWRARAVWKEPGIAEALRPMTDRLDRLAAIARQSDRTQLARDAAGPEPGHFEAARAAWKRLGELPAAWPGTAPELRQDMDIHRRMMAVYALVEDAGAKPALQQELRAETQRRWESYFVSRTEPAEVDSAVQRMGEFYLRLDEPSGLGPVCRFRLALYQLRHDVLGGRTTAGDKALRDRVGRFVAETERLPDGLAGKPPVAGFLAELKRLAAAKGTGADLGKAGPALAGWTSRAAADQSTVTYTWGSHSLNFVRVEPQGARASYLCTTEVSVGLFIDVATSRRRWHALRRLLLSYAGGEDPRLGPRTWQPAADDGRITDALSWCRRPHGLTPQEFYAEGLKVGAPARGHPMQYVSAQAAVYVARLLGTRLPSSAEWRHAWRTFEKTHPGQTPNRRDKTWAKQRDHIATLEGRGKLHSDMYSPDAGIFWPKGTAERKVGREAETLPTDDGLLWFAKVDSGKPAKFHHLVGNVNEFVFEDPASLQKLQVDGDQLVPFLGRAADKLRVIGASALSAPGLEPETPQAVDFGRASRGYADVGFRLAFTAPAESLHTRLRRLLQARGYLAGASK